jgi:hypothetical protein
MAEQFISTTVGLECNGYGQLCKLVTIDVYRDGDGYILQPASGRNMSKQAGRTRITAERYDSIESDPYDQAARAIEMMRLCGWVPSALDEGDDDDDQ